MGLADTYKPPHRGSGFNVTDKVVQKAEPGWLEELLFALLQVKAPTYSMRYGFEVALQRLASAPGDADRIATVRTIAERGRTWGDVDHGPAEVAEWPACGQPAEHLLAVARRAGRHPGNRRPVHRTGRRPLHLALLHLGLAHSGALIAGRGHGRPSS